jgi:diguanylate cyclase (GGDEF)-like protein
MGGDGTAENRDQSAEARDQASEARDERAAARDERAQVRDRVDGDVNSEAATDRAGALQDRRRAAADRVRSAREQAAFSIDEVTGAHRRDAGLVELRREMVRAKRTKQPLALAFIDVDDLKGTNDSLGHAAGDRLLRETADCIRTYLRSYDLIIRFGGDEFLCALLDMNVAEATERFSLVSANLAATCQASVTVGLAELETEDALEDLIARADEAMYRERQQSRSAGA